MAYDELLAERISNELEHKNVSFSEKKMFGGIAFMVDEKMCVGVVKDNLMARIDPAFYEEALGVKGCKAMDFTGRPMRGFVYVTPEGLDLEDDLEFWINKCLEFNPKAKSKKKK